MVGQTRWTVITVLLALGWAWLIAVASPGIVSTTFETDLVHLSDLVLRYEVGQQPHLDFMTPLGVLSYAPIAWAMGLGLPLGTAALVAQAGLATALAVPLVWIGVTRLGPLAPVYVGGAIILATALNFGGVDTPAGFAMHYNRWAMVFVWLVVPVVLLPAASGRDTAVLDGVLIGLGLSAMALIKATFVVALLPGLVVALVLRGATRTLIVAAGTALFSAALAFVLLGPSVMIGYLRDLLFVLTSDGREAPTNTFGTVAGSAGFLPYSAAAILAYLGLKASGARAAAVGVLLLWPGLLYVTYQNFGNDVNWAPLLGVIAGAAALTATAGRVALGVAAAVLLVLQIPVWLTFVGLQARNMVADLDAYTPLLETRDLALYTDPPAEPGQLDVTLPLRLSDGALADFRLTGLTDLDGAPLPNCDAAPEYANILRRMGDRIAAAGLPEGTQLLLADAISGVWMAADLAPLPGGVPWYYGGDPGLAAADIVATPVCAGSVSVRQSILDLVQDRGLATEVVYEDALVRLHRIIR